MTAIGKKWDKLKDKAKAPIKFVIETVLNRPHRSVQQDRGRGRARQDRRPGAPPRIPRRRLDRAGVDHPAGIVHADEFVIRKESRARIERDAPGLSTS